MERVAVAAGGGGVKLVFSQLATYSVVGAVAAATNFSVLIVLVQDLGANPVVASMAGFVAAALVSYVLNYHITFRCKNPHNTALAKFFVVALVGLGLNTLIMAVLLKWLYYVICQALAIPVVLLWNFTCNRFWTFREAVEG